MKTTKTSPARKTHGAAISGLLAQQSAAVRLPRELYRLVGGGTVERCAYSDHRGACYSDDSTMRRWRVATIQPTSSHAKFWMKKNVDGRTPVAGLGPVWATY
jgi:hypothetical protein